MKFKTYNKLYFKGKPVSKTFMDYKALRAKNISEAKKIAKKTNAEWNGLKMNRNYKVKLVKVKKA